MAKRKGKCRGEGCESTAEYRGLCNGCYRSLWHMVNRGETTWEELEKLGIVAVSHGQGRRPRKIREAALAAIKQNKSAVAR